MSASVCEGEEEMNFEPFFEFARKRQDAFLKKDSEANPPYSDDPILQNWYFTNVYRENDKTTVWFREEVRRDIQLTPEVIPATMLFRWFNRINIGETIFKQLNLMTERTPFQDYIQDNDINALKASIRNAHPTGPYVNGAYIIKAHNGMDKLSGVLQAFHNAMEFMNRKYDREDGFRTLADHMIAEPSMERATRFFAEIPYLGMFMAYEIVCDLRYTAYLHHAPDKMTWANPGPGARRGLNRLVGNHPDVPLGGIPYIVKRMKELLDASPRYGWTDWEMREVEHTLCEFDKYERIREGGRGKRRYGGL
jgi:hypothetical protein